MFCVLKTKFNFSISNHIIICDSIIIKAEAIDIDTRINLPGFQVNAIFVYARLHLDEALTIVYFIAANPIQFIVS